MPAQRTRVDVAEEDELPYADDEPRDAVRAEVGFRTPGGIVERSAELEQQVGQLRDRLRAMEREVYDARKVLRRRRVTSAFMTGGIGATVGALVATVLWLFGGTESAGVVLALVLVGWFFGALAGYKWDKGDFPDAPPERLR